jgi:two-component system response regulator (stage 0 sporulation protein A)
MIRVLIADNNVGLCKILQEFLDQQQDLEVVGLAYDGEEALHKIQETQPDVVILDLTMPQLDGIGVMERLRELSLRHTPRIIILTAFARDEMVRRLTDLGADYFIVKPFDLQILVERIREFAGNSSSNLAAPGANFYSQKNSRQPEVLITELLHNMGVPPNFKGYTYLREAVLLACRNHRLVGGGLSKELYPRLAEKYETTVGGVEAAIRNAINSAWHRGNREFVESLTSPLECDEDRLPTNSLIIAKLVDRINLELNN